MTNRIFAALFAVVLVLFVSPCYAATCYVTEFVLTADAGVQVARQPALVEQTVSVSGTSAQSSAFGADTKLVRIHCDAIVSMTFGANPTATTGKMRAPADSIEYFQVVPGTKVAFITNT